jgi:hypothetical protein
MAILSQISVGDIMYYQVDDIPDHTAPKGSVALMDSSSIYDNGFTYINNDGGSTWLKCISPSYGRIYLNNGTTTVTADDAQVLLSWYAFNANDTWIRDPNSNTEWILSTEDASTDDLKYTGTTTLRVLVSQDSTMRSGTSKWISWQTGVSFNFTIPLNWNEGFGFDNATTSNQGSHHCLEFVTNNYILSAISPRTREAGGGAASRAYIPKHSQLSAIKIDEPLIDSRVTTLLDEDWESNSFTANTWNVVNDTTNQWVIGTAQVSGGTYGLYGSNDGGTTANYSNAGDVSHIYKDFTFPSSAETITLTFTWRSFMENAGGATQYDYGTVNIIDTTTTPVAGTEVATALATGTGNGRVNETGANAGKFNEGYKYGGGVYDGTWFTETIDLSVYAGTTKRLVFSFADDGAVPADAPAMSIDNILLTYGVGNIY